MAEKKMFIDGVECPFTNERNVLEVARKNGIDIPSLWVAGLAAQVQHAPRREVRPVGPTCRAERKGGEAQGS